jgi:hypothetical protein
MPGQERSRWSHCTPGLPANSSRTDPLRASSRFAANHAFAAFTKASIASLIASDGRAQSSRRGGGGLASASSCSQGTASSLLGGMLGFEGLLTEAFAASPLPSAFASLEAEFLPLNYARVSCRCSSQRVASCRTGSPKATGSSGSSSPRRLLPGRMGASAGAESRGECWGI